MAELNAHDIELQLEDFDSRLQEWGATAELQTQVLILIARLLAYLVTKG